MDKKRNPREETEDHHALRVLLIEDSDTDAHLIERALRKYMKNAECIRSATLKSGEEVLQQGKVDVLLLDLGLPDTTGPADTYAQIKKWTGHLPVVIMTNLKDHDLARTMVHEGAADFLNKDAISKEPAIVHNAIDFSIERHTAHRLLKSEKEKATKESKEKDTILSCFMGGYSVGDGEK